MRSFLTRMKETINRFGADKSEFAPDENTDGILRPNKEWAPQKRTRRVEIMVTGDPSRIEAVADSIDLAQKHIQAEASSGDPIETRVTAFLDNCTHRTKWSRKTFKTSARARMMHCKQSQTKIADALTDSQGEIVDDIILIGHRFDDNFIEAAAKIDELRDAGVAVHCFHTGNDTESRAAYEELAQKSGGVFLQLADQRELDKVMPILMQHIKNDTAKLELTPANRQELIDTLRARLLKAD